MQVKPPKVLSASELCSDPVTNVHGERLGKMEEVMIDLERGRVAYCFISFGSKTMGKNKYFAVPWEALQISFHDRKVIFDVSEETLKEAPGFDKKDWPQEPDTTWLAQVYRCYDCVPYWEVEQT